MEDHLTEFRIKNPLHIRTLLSLFFVIVLELQLLMNNFRNIAHPHTNMRYFLLVWITLCGIFFVLILFRACQRAGEIKYTNDSLFINKRTIHAKDIKSINIDGPIVGILPRRNRIVPPQLCFRFIDDQEASMKRMIIWAETNGIKLKYRRFVKWM